MSAGYWDRSSPERGRLLSRFVQHIYTHTYTRIHTFYGSTHIDPTTECLHCTANSIYSKAVEARRSDLVIADSVLRNSTTEVHWNDACDATCTKKNRKHEKWKSYVFFTKYLRIFYFDNLIVENIIIEYLQKNCTW